MGVNEPNSADFLSGQRSSPEPAVDGHHVHAKLLGYLGRPESGSEHLRGPLQVGPQQGTMRGCPAALMVPTAERYEAVGGMGWALSKAAVVSL